MVTDKQEHKQRPFLSPSKLIIAITIAIICIIGLIYPGVVSFVALGEQTAVTHDLLSIAATRQAGQLQEDVVVETAIFVPSPIPPTPVANEPIKITLSHLATEDNEELGTFVVSLFIEGDDSPVFVLEEGEGGEENGRFLIYNNQLIAHPTNGVALQPELNVRIKATTSDGEITSFPLIVTVAGLQQDDTDNLVLNARTYRGSISPIFTKEVKFWEPQIAAWAAQYDLDPNIIATIMQIESCGDPDAQSYAGARGLFQVMPDHFTDGEDMYNPNINANRGLSYYKRGLQIHNGDIFLSFAGYNGGHGTVRHNKEQWPDETQRYHYWSTGIYTDARSGLTVSPMLQEWLLANGNGLCQQASHRLGL